MFEKYPRRSVRYEIETASGQQQQSKTFLADRRGEENFDIYVEEHLKQRMSRLG